MMEDVPVTNMQKLEGHICKTFTLVKMFLKMFISVQKKMQS